jgi:glyoxylase-like metal-dependent hydrolase (beta-lactamase superfamily II)
MVVAAARWGLPIRTCGETAMRKLVAAALLATACAGLSPGPTSHAQPSPGVERLYILYCGEGTAGDISLWSPGVNVGKSMELSVNCYLIKHAQGWLLWDTGVADAVVAMPDGLPPPNPRMTRYRRTTTLASQLEQLGIKPADIMYVAVSHTHPDHVGNIAMFPQSTVLVQKAEYDWPTPFGQRLHAIASPLNQLEGDHDVFGDGSAVLIATPGHTPGHQSLLVRLPKTGAILLSGDVVHFQSNWENRRIPQINFDQAKSAASMQRIADIMAKEKTQLWINHDKQQSDGLRLSPAFYE